MVDYASYLQTLFAFVWECFTSWTIPIIGLTPAVFLLSMMVFSVITFVFKRAIGVGSSGVAQGARGAIFEGGRLYARHKRKLERSKRKSK